MLEREVVGTPSRGLRPVPSSSSGRTRSPSRSSNQGGGGAGSLDASKASPRPGLSSSTVNKPRVFVSANHVATVEKAVKERKVFCIGGVYHAIRAALKNRGWIEKAVNTTVPQYMRSIINPTLVKDVDTRPVSDEEAEASYTQRILANYAPDFIWVIRRDNIAWGQLQRDQMINRFPRAYFTTKVGIAACLQSIHWFSDPGISNTYFPRCYRLSLEDEKQAFLDDYRLTACVGLLRWFITNYEKLSDAGVYDTTSKISCLSLDFALRQLNNYIRMRRHEDIDWLLPPAFLNQHWEIFLHQYYNVVHQKFKLNPADGSESPRNKYDSIRKTLLRLAPYWTSMTADGILNLWICKPGARSRGKGIVIMNQLDKIIGLLETSQAREANWVVQKYIERPLLIYKTKFDVRQWFIVTDWAPLTVWFAKESYVRFCTKPFSLDDFHESIHLCNNAVQCKYQNAQNRDPALPEENMWDCYTFQAYLKTIGKLDLWDKVIYPGMKEGIMGVLLASQDVTEAKKNSFELYGADYMFTEDMKPWLIEINSCPCMAGSTSVTARMCAQCLEDTIKVVIDRKHDKNADTGMFELIYRQNPTTLHFASFNSNELLLTGKQMNRDVDWPGLMTKHVSRHNFPPRKKSMPKVPLTIPDPALTFTDLVHKLHLKETARLLSEIPSSSPYESVQRALNQPSPRTTAPSGPLLTTGATSTFHQKSKGSVADGKGILSVRKIILPQPKEAPSSSKSTDVVRNALSNNNNTINTSISNTSRAKLDSDKSGIIPLSYLMYNAKTNPVTISDMIRDYEESRSKTSATAAIQLFSRKGVEQEPAKKGKGKLRSPKRTKAPSVRVPATNKSSSTLRNKTKGQQQQKPSGSNNNNNGSRAEILTATGTASLRPLSLQR